MQQPKQLEFEADYAFRPTPANCLAGIPEQYQDGLVDGSLELVQRRGVTPTHWCIVKAQPAPDRKQAWPANSVVHDLHRAPDLALFVPKDEPDADRPLGSRFVLDTVKFARQQKRRVRAERAAASFNALAGTKPRAVESLTDSALAILRLRRHHNEERVVWMYRSLERAVSELVMADHAKVSPDGYVETAPAAVEKAMAEWDRRQLNLKWQAPRHLWKRLEATIPFRRRSGPPVKEPELLYPMADIWTDWYLKKLGLNL